MQLTTSLFAGTWQSFNLLVQSFNLLVLFWWVVLGVFRYFGWLEPIRSTNWHSLALMQLVQEIAQAYVYIIIWLNVAL